MLAVVPEHPAARQARSRAWQQIAAISPAAAAQWPARAARGGQAQPAADHPRGAGRAEPVAATATTATDPRPVAERPRRPRPTASSGSAARRDAPPRPAADRPAAIDRPPGRPSPRASRPCPPARWPGREADGPRGRFLLWVDGVGGYLVCMDDRIVLGRAGPDSHADVPLMGDLSRNHATLVRNGEGYLLQAHQASFVNGKPVAEQVVLRDGDVIRLGSTVELEFRQPSPVSATARLAIVSRHRLPLAVDGVLLMAETCIVGGPAQAHIPAPSLAATRSSSTARPAPSGAAPRRLRCRR